MWVHWWVPWWNRVIMNVVCNRHSRSKQLEQLEHDKAQERSPSFALPPVPQPTAMLETLTDRRQGLIKTMHGTTTLAFRFSNGIVVATDSRASVGNWIGSQTVKKVLEINRYLLGTMAGGAADCQYWETWLGIQCRLHELRNGSRISVAAASKMLANLIYSYKGMGLSMGTMIAGFDRHDSSIYYVDSDGTRLKGDMFCVGSGATFAYGVLDSAYAWEMAEEQAVALARRSILAATHRDAYSGGSVNMYLVKAEGWRQLGFDDAAPLYEQAMRAEGHAN